MEANHTTPDPARRRARRFRRAASATLATTVAASSALALVAADPASAEYFNSALPRMVSRTNAGGAVPGYVDDVAISGNGRFVAFVTSAALVGEDTNGKADVYVRDRWAAVTELVSVRGDEKPLDGASLRPSLSDDGRYVAFLSKASNLISGDDKGLDDAFVRDRYAGTTTRVAPGSGNTLLTHPISQVQIAGAGRYVVFSTQSDNVVANDTNGSTDVFVRDLQSSTIQRVSLTAAGSQSMGTAANPSISDDGRYVVFDHTGLLAGGVLNEQNVYVRDRVASTTALVNVDSAEQVPDEGAAAAYISGNGRAVVFASEATNLVANDTNGVVDVFLRDLTAGTTERVGLPDSVGELPTGAGTVPFGISDDGTRVLFRTPDPATAGTDVGNDVDLFMRNRTSGRTQRITTSPTTQDPGANSFFGSIDDTGRSVAFRITQKMSPDAAFDQAYVYGGVPMGPIAPVAEMIDQLHQDFLGRAATSAETSTWTAHLTNGSADLATLVGQLVANPTFADSRAPMVRMYWAFFLRRPDPSGLNYWLGRYQAGVKLTTIAQSFATSSEFKNRYGNVGNQQYVKLVYENVFGRLPDPSGLGYWTGKLDRKEITRGGVIVQFSESSEGKRRLAGPTNITLISMAMLRSTPSAALWNELYPTIAAGEKQAAWIGRQILASDAYDARFP